MDSAVAGAGYTWYPAFWNGCLWEYDADMYLVKSTLEGDIIWTQRIGSPSHAEQAISIANTVDGGFVLAGLGTVVSNNPEMLLVKTDPFGQVTWAKSAGRPGYDVARQVRQTSDGGYVVAGNRTDTINSGGLCILKFDASGDTVWTRIFRSATVAFDQAHSILQNSDGDYLITGTVSNPTGLCLMKLSNSGNLLWAKNFEGGNLGRSICQTHDGGYVILGTHDYPLDPQLYLIRTTATGDTVWTKTYGGPGVESAWCVIESSDGGFILSGGTRASIFSDDDAYILRIDSIGNLIWAWSYGEGGDDYASSVLEMTDGGVVAAGPYNADTGSASLYLLRTDSSGSTGCNEQVAAVMTSIPPVTISNVAFQVISGFSVSTLSFTSTPYGSMSPICLTTATQESSDGHTMLVYPNPAFDRIAIRTHGKGGIWNYEITDMNGRVLIQRRSGNASELFISIERLAPGTYVVRASNDDRTQFAKLIVQSGLR